MEPKGEKKGRGYAPKHKVLALVDRSTGRGKSIVVDDLKAKTLAPILKILPERQRSISTRLVNTVVLARNLLITISSATLLANGVADQSIPTLSKAISAFASAA